MRRQLPSLILVSILSCATESVAGQATAYGRIGISVDYLDAEPSATWHRPGVATPSFDALSFIHAGNAALHDAGYTAALPPPRELDTVIGDLLFGTIPFEGLDPATRRRIFGALDAAMTDGKTFRGWDLNANSRGNRLGVRGAQDLGGSIKAIYQIELGIPITDEDGSLANGDPGGISMRNSYLGLAGDWGSLLVGRHDTPAKMSTGRLDLFADTLADYNFTVGFDDLRADNSILYISPELWGLQFTGALIPAGGATIAGGSSTQADALAAGWSAALSYRRGPFFASAAYEVLGSELWAHQDGAYDMVHAVFADDESKWRLGLGVLDWNGFSLTGLYESRENVLGMPVDASADLWQVQTGYAFGNNQIKAMYGAADLGACADPLGLGFRYTCRAGKLGQMFPDRLGGLGDQTNKRTWALGFDHSFSQRTKVYTLYTTVDDDKDSSDWSGFSMGMMHSF